MEKKPRLGIDLDTTLNNLEVEWLRRYNEEYDDNMQEWPSWDIENHVKPECGLSIFKYLREPGFFYGLKIRENAKEVIDYLLKYFDIYIVTAYSSDVCVDKTNWIKENLPNIDYRNIIFCNDKSTLNLDYLIDDGPHNIEGFKQTGIIYDMLYNRYLNKNKYKYRVKNWLEIKEIFDHFIKVREKSKNLIKKNEKILV